MTLALYPLLQLLSREILLFIAIIIDKCRLNQRITDNAIPSYAPGRQTVTSVHGKTFFLPDKRHAPVWSGRNVSVKRAAKKRLTQSPVKNFQRIVTEKPHTIALKKHGGKALKKGSVKGRRAENGKKGQKKYFPRGAESILKSYCSSSDLFFSSSALRW